MNLEVIVRRPQGETKPTPLLFIHGAWHGAWCWDEYFLPHFAQHGYNSYALSVRAHGKSESDRSIRLCGILDYVADAAQVANQIEAETGQRPVVIGHSMGGFIVQKYLERHSAPAAVLLASIPVIGTLPFNLRMTRHFPLRTLMTLAGLNARPYVSTPQLAKKHFFSEDMPLDKVAEYQRRMDGESLRVLLDGNFFNRPQPKKVKPTPILVIAAENDRVFTLKEEINTARAYDTEAVIIPHLAHDVMVEPRWQVAADEVLKWLTQKGF
jgi:hypothetical protein